MMIKGVDYSATELREILRRFLVEHDYLPNGNWYFLKTGFGLTIRVNPTCSYSYEPSNNFGHEVVVIHMSSAINESGTGIISYKVDSAETFEEIMGFLERISAAKESKEKIIALYSNLEDLIQVAQL